MNREELQLALGILSGRIETLANREQYKLLGLEYDPDHNHCIRKGRGWLNLLRRCAEDVLLETLSERSAT